MFHTARIAGVLALAVILADVPAQALNLKNWEALPDRDQIQYVSGCVARLVIALGKTDNKRAEQLRHYFGDKATGAKFSQGMLDLLARIVRVENMTKDPDAGFTLSDIEVEDQILKAAVAKVGPMPSGLTRATISGPVPAKPDFQQADKPRSPTVKK